MGTDAPPGGSDQEPADRVKNAPMGAPGKVGLSDRPRRVPDWPVQWWFVRMWWLWAIAAVPAGIATWNAAHDFPIVQLELAGTEAHAAALLGDASLDSIRSAIAWDFLFILLYALALFLGCLWASQYFVSGLGRNRLRSIGEQRSRPRSRKVRRRMSPSPQGGEEGLGGGVVM